MKSFGLIQTCDLMNPRSDAVSLSVILHNIVTVLYNFLSNQSSDSGHHPCDSLIHYNRCFAIKLPTTFVKPQNCIQSRDSIYRLGIATRLKMGIAGGAIAGGAIAGSALSLRGAIAKTPANHAIVMHTNGASNTFVEEVQEYPVHGLPTVDDVVNAYGDALFQDVMTRFLL